MIISQTSLSLFVELGLNTPLEILIYCTELVPECMDSAHDILMGPVEPSILHLQPLAIFDMLCFFIFNCQIAFIIAILLVERSDIVLHFFVEFFQERVLLTKFLRQNLLMFDCDQIIFNTTHALLSF
jgi:hypothetical protein